MGWRDADTVGIRRVMLRGENVVLRAALRAHKTIERTLGRVGGNPVETWQHIDRISQTIHRNERELAELAGRDPWEKLD